MEAAMGVHFVFKVRRQQDRHTSLHRLLSNVQCMWQSHTHPAAWVWDASV
jgi:hypothetical protein